MLMMPKILLGLLATTTAGGVAISPLAPIPVRVFVKEPIGWPLTPPEALHSAKGKAGTIRDDLRSAVAEAKSREIDQAALEERVPAYKDAAERAAAKAAFAKALLAVQRDKYDVGGVKKTRAQVERDSVRLETEAASADRHHKAIAAAAEASAKALDELKLSIADREIVLLSLGKEIEVAEILMKANQAHAALNQLLSQVRGLNGLREASGESFVEQLRVTPLVSADDDEYARAVRPSSTN